MKLTFKDGGYIELVKSDIDGNYRVTIAAHSPQKPNEKIVNSAELTPEEMLSLLSSVGLK